MTRAALALCLLAAPVVAQDIPECAASPIMTRLLTELAGETLRSAGLTAQTVVEVYVSDKTGTWTIVSADPATGISCIALAGDAWQSVGAAKGSPL